MRTVTRPLTTPLTAEEALRRIAGRRYPVLAPIGEGRWAVAAAPSEVAIGADVWDALAIPCDDVDPQPEHFAGGWFGFLGDALADTLERLPRAAPDPGGPPVAWMGRYPTLAVFAGDACTLVTTEGDDALDDLERALTAPVSPADHRPDPVPRSVMQSSLPATGYRVAVQRIRELIGRGDCCQVNMTQRLTAPWRAGPLAFAERLWEAGGATAHRAYVGLERGAVVSASPELLVRVRGRIAESDPIKGTAPVGQWERLAASVKDRAEHVMIVDLIRNDLGRVAVPGRVSVPRLFAHLPAGYVEHMVSTVRAELRPGITAAEVLRAVFPGGSVTGTPKLRAIEIIRELEPVARGPAYGSILAVSRHGAILASVAIRTAWVTDAEVRYWCGGAVVWDSDPNAELAEAMAKARPFLTAIGVA